MNKSRFIKTYRIVRTVEEVYQVRATSRQVALNMDKEGPSSVTVIREKAYLISKEKGGKNG